MEFRYSDDFLKILELSRDEALRTGWHCIGPDHIMLGILRHSDNPACECLRLAGISPEDFKEYLDSALFSEEEIPWSDRDKINLSRSALSLLGHAAQECLSCADNRLEPLHYVFACCHVAGPHSYDYLFEHGVELRALVEASGIDWCVYGHSGEARKKEAAAPDPQILAAAIEKRIREGYTTGNPLLN